MKKLISLLLLLSGCVTTHRFKTMRDERDWWKARAEFLSYYRVLWRGDEEEINEFESLSERAAHKTDCELRDDLSRFGIKVEGCEEE